MLKFVQTAAAAVMFLGLLSAGTTALYQTPEDLAAAEARGIAARQAFCPAAARLTDLVKGGLLSVGGSAHLPYKAEGKGFVRESRDFSNETARRVDAAAERRIRAAGRSNLARTLLAAWRLLLDRTAETIAAAMLLLPLTAALVLDGIWRRKAAVCEEKRPGRLRQSLASAGLALEAAAAPVLMMQPSGWHLGMSVGAVLAAGMLLGTWLANTERWE